MQINRYTNIQPARYTPRTLQELMMVPAYKRQQHDLLDVSSADLEQKIGELQSLKTDDPIVQAEQQKLKEKLTNQSDILATKGFTSTSKSDFQKLNSDYQRFMSSTGIGGKASSNYAAYVANEKDLKDLYQKGKISKEKYQLGLQSASDKYSQAGGVASNTTYNPFVASLDQDIDSRARQIALDIQKNVGEYLKGVGDIYESLYSVNNIKTTKSGYYDPLEIHKAKKKIDDEYENKEIDFEKWTGQNVNLFHKDEINKLKGVIAGDIEVVGEDYMRRGEPSLLTAIADVLTGNAPLTDAKFESLNDPLKRRVETVFK